MSSTKNQFGSVASGSLATNRRFWIAATVLAAVMAVTRVGHFGEYGGPVDASWAVFFLAGMWLKEARLFPAFFLVAWLSDLLAFALGTPTDCYSIAYLFLVPAYGALWFAGRIAADGGYGRIGVAVLGGAAATFFLSNLGMFLLAPSPGATSVSAFASAVIGYFPGYLLTTILYVAFGLIADRALALRSLRRA